MPSPLVTQVRQLLADRETEGQPITAPERALLIATISRRHDEGPDTDALDDVDAAIATVRRTLLADPGFTGPHRDALKTLIAATRRLIDYDPPVVVDHPTPTADTLPHRLDVDGYTDRN